MYRLGAVVTTLALLMLAACGGGGSSTTNNNNSGGGTGTALKLSLSASPNACAVGSSCTVTVTATVTPGTVPTSTGISVTGDMHSCTGGSSSQAFTGSGTVFTYSCTLPTGSPITANTPTPVTVTAGSTVSSINITGPTGAAASAFTLGPVTATDAQHRTSSSSVSNPDTLTIGIAPNATMIGAAVPAAPGSSTSLTLSAAPAVVHLSTLPANGQLILALAGTGLASGSGSSATLLVNSAVISGPSDIAIGNMGALTNPSAGDQAVGVGIRITLTPSTATGARTVFLKDSHGYTTAFSGGLEILP